VAQRQPTVDDLLDQADAVRTAGRGDHAARLYAKAAARSRADDDLAGWTRAVLGAASVHLFGAEPGRLPAELYDVLARTTDDADRARLTAALARCWAYAGNPARSARFADEALTHAQRAGGAELIADCLDAALAAHWGPDELSVRRDLATRLDEVAAHVRDPDARLQAHLWGLHVACETLDLPAVHRQMRALDLLGEESPRAQFFAASRRLMLDLLRGRTERAAELAVTAAQAAEHAGLADAWMVVKAMRAYTAAVAGDAEACAAGAAECEAFALAEGMTAVAAEAAFLWACAGRLDRARTLVGTFGGDVLRELPRDVNWLLTLQCVLEAALATGDREVIATAANLLTPYEGRAVINGGAVNFHGVTDDTLARAARVLGEPETAERLYRRALDIYDRLGATWWRHRLEKSSARPQPATARMLLRPSAAGVWQIGPEGSAVSIRKLRGFDHLRMLLRHPHQYIAALDLIGGGTGVLVESGLGQHLDQQAIATYKQRLRDLDQDIAEADEWADLGRTATLREERDALIAELARATGLGGRTRTAGSSQERARIATRKAIAAAIDRIAAVDAGLGRHLHRCIRTGLTCAYLPEPDDAIDWVLDQPKTVTAF
jgi:tetratricopeptide (TPR) repeat protein